MSATAANLSAVPIGRLQTEGDLRRFIEDVLDGSPYASAVRSLVEGGYTRGRIDVTFNGSQQTVDTVVQHGLGRTPVVVLGTSISGACMVVETFSYTATEFTGRVSYPGLFSSQTPVAGNYPFVWLAT